MSLIQWVGCSERRIYLSIVIKIIECPITTSVSVDADDSEDAASDVSSASAYNAFNLHCDLAAWVGRLYSDVPLSCGREPSVPRRLRVVSSPSYPLLTKQEFFPTLPTVAPWFRASDFLRDLQTGIPGCISYYAHEIVTGVTGLALGRGVCLEKLLNRKATSSIPTAVSGYMLDMDVTPQLTALLVDESFCARNTS